MNTQALESLTRRWAEAVGVPSERLGGLAAFRQRRAVPRLRPGVARDRLDQWEQSHGFRLPRGLRAWLLLSDGLHLDPGVPLIHPLASIGPMVQFARVPGLLIQPESWFELGNPGTETVCIDLAYTWPEGDYPLFTSGDDLRSTRPRLIAGGFEEWLLRLLEEGGRTYWLEPAFPSLGDPWLEHRRRAPAPPLPERLRSLAPSVQPMLMAGADDRLIASSFGITRWDVEALVRHLQHVPNGSG